MKKHDGKLVAILGTIIVHLIAAIIFMSLQIRSLKIELSNEFVIEFAPVEESVVKEEMIELPATTVERILKGDDEMLNIARNLANKTPEKINPADYIDKVKDELIKSGKLGVDNYIDEQKKLLENKDAEKLAFKNDSSKLRENEKPSELQKMEANYKGPTRIYYDLAGRNHLYLPIPIYKCEGSGMVVLSIDVNQKGKVEKALVISAQSSTSDACLIETAVKTALVSRFNPDARAPEIQTGTLSYQFVAQ